MDIVMVLAFKAEGPNSHQRNVWSGEDRALSGAMVGCFVVMPFIIVQLVHSGAG
jgi:hypothetical protein